MIMESKLYVGNLSYNTTEERLRTAFAEAGTVVAIDVIKDRDTGQMKGFAFVTMGNQEEAENAIKSAHANPTITGAGKIAPKLLRSG
jgi:RNA recognition motif-containing protein